MIKNNSAVLIRALAALMTLGAAQAQASLPDDYGILIERIKRDLSFETVAEAAGQNKTLIAPLTVGYQFSATPDQRTAYGSVVPGLSRFFGMAESPVSIDSFDAGSRVDINLRRSFLKPSSDSTLSYTYSLGQLELNNFLPQDRRCPDFRCMFAEVTARAGILDSSGNVLWAENKTATLYTDRGAFNTSVESDSFFGGLSNADWSWTFEQSDSVATFTLDGSFSAMFDLSLVNPGETFTAVYGMTLTAFDVEGSYSNLARALAADPLTGNAGDGNGFGLVPTGLAPVPEPASWLLSGAGLLAVAAATRRKRAAQVLA